MRSPKSTGRRFAPIMLSNDSLGRSNVARTRWLPRFATRGAACCFSTPSFAVSSSTSLQCHRHRKRNQPLSFYTQLDILPYLHRLLHLSNLAKDLRHAHEISGLLPVRFHFL